MGGLTDFLFGGTAPANVTSTGSTSTSLPQFMQDYSQRLLAQAALQGTEGYQTYQGPRIAGFNQDQQKAFEKVREVPETYEDVLNTSKQAYANSAKTLPESISDYMNPYTENVTNRARDLAMRDWNDNIMPGISDIFMRNGTYASSGMADRAIRGGQGVVEGLQGQYNANLADAYDKSAGYFDADADRSLSAAQLGGGLAETIQGLGLNDANALMNAGSAQQDQTQRNLDLAYQDFQDQRDFPWDQLERMGGLLDGLPYGETTTTSETGPLSGAEYGPSGLQNVISGVTAGKGLWDLFKNG